MAKGGGIPGIAVGMATAGAFLMYIGIAGASIRDGIKTIASGRLPELKPPKGEAISKAEEQLARGNTLPDSGGGGSNSKLVSAALKYRGVPYKWGGTSRSGLDCSGLVVLAFRDAYGVIPPRTTYVQIGWSKLKKVSSIQAGDLLFWPRVGPPSHVGIAVDSQKVVHAAKPGTRVKVVPIGRAFTGGARPVAYRYTGEK